MNKNHSVKIYKEYPYLSSRKGIWAEISSYIDKDINDNQFIVEIGSGYCDFINNITALKKVAYDLNPKMQDYASQSVDFRAKDAVKMEGLNNGEVSVFFASNFLEHLDQQDAEKILSTIHKKLKINGQFILIQPNYRLCKEHYFDDPTHKTIYTDESMSELLQKHNFHITKKIARFLPFSMKTRFPKWPFLVKWYLKLPYRPMAAQMYFVTERR